MSLTKCTKCGKEMSSVLAVCVHCGSPLHDDDANFKFPTSSGGSYFDGGVFQLLGWTILGAMLTFFTFGICFPWALCMVYGWRVNHTVIEGRRLKFNGTAMSLFGNWIVWLLLSVITFGIYGFWVGIALEKWKVKNTTFA